MEPGLNAAIPEAVTDPTRWFGLWQMLHQHCCAVLSPHAAELLQLPEWCIGRVYDGKLYIFMPGVVLIYDYHHIMSYVRAYHKAQKDNACDSQPKRSSDSTRPPLTLARAYSNIWRSASLPTR